PAELAGLGRFIHEPDPALIRSGLIGAFAKANSLTAVASDIAYLSSGEYQASRWLRSFEVAESLPIDKKVLRKRLAELGIGKLEIKKRGIDLDPAQLRKELKLNGEDAATLILTRVGDARRALVCNEC
ncbi:MAG: SAM-dependent methyltransferase, partial [Aquiluna sp.]